MKKLLSILLCMCLVLGLAACGNKPSKKELEEAKQQSEIVKEEREQTLERVEEEEEKEEVNPTDVLGGPIEYKMVELGNFESNGEYNYIFAVQLPPTIDGVSYQLDVTDKEGTTLRLSEDVVFNSFESAIITDSFKEEMFEKFDKQLEKSKAEGADPDMLKYGFEYPYAITDDNCTSLYVFTLKGASPIDMSNYLVTLKRGQTWGNVSEELNLTVNGTEADLNLAPYFISGHGLIKLNGKYMLLNSGSSGLGGSGVAAYQIYHFYDLFDMSKGEKDVTSYTAVPVEWYYGKEKVSLKEGWSLHFVVEPNYDGDLSYEIGLKGPESDIEEMESFIHENKPCLMTDNGPVILR